MSVGEAAQPALLNAFLLTTKDALMVFEASRRGICPVVNRRLHDTEKLSLIASGTVFAFDEQLTGIKRWTDGLVWSPSRIIGNYLVYRELDKKGTGDGGRTKLQSSVMPANGAAPGDPFEGAEAKQGPLLENPESRPETAGGSGTTGLQRDLERALVGSLTSSYRFKQNGLVKKTISNGNLHLVSYYSIDDVIAGRLRTPSSLIELASLEISSALLDAKSFRVPPITEVDHDGSLHYIAEEADPVGAPASLAPLLIPGAGPPPNAASSEPIRYAEPEGMGIHPSHEHPASAFRPLEEYDTPVSAPAAYYHPQYPPQRTSSGVRALWAEQSAEAGPSSWYDQSVPDPTRPLQRSIPSSHFQNPYNGVSGHHEAYYGQEPANPSRQIGQPMRRHSQRTMQTPYAFGPRAIPYARSGPGSLRPATSPVVSYPQHGPAHYGQGQFDPARQIEPTTQLASPPLRPMYQSVGDGQTIHPSSAPSADSHFQSRSPYQYAQLPAYTNSPPTSQFYPGQPYPMQYYDPSNRSGYRDIPPRTAPPLTYPYSNSGQFHHDYSSPHLPQQVYQEPHSAPMYCETVAHPEPYLQPSAYPPQPPPGTLQHQSVAEFDRSLTPQAKREGTS